MKHTPLCILLTGGWMVCAYYSPSSFGASIAAGYNHSLIVKNDGTVAAMGDNYYGQLGNEKWRSHETSAVQVLNLEHIVAVAAGQGHSLFLRNDGTVWACGENSYGALGSPAWIWANVPVIASNLSDVVAIAAGSIHSVALKSDGSVWTWGCNVERQLGIGTESDKEMIPVQVSGLSGVTAIFAHKEESFAIKQDGSLWGWGYNENGELGDGTTTTRSTPVRITSITGVVSIAMSGWHTLALKYDGTVWAWGWNYSGALGQGDTTERHILTPVQVIGSSNVVAVGAGSGSYALNEDGTVWAWGYAEAGPAGGDAWIYHALPEKVAGSANVIDLAISEHRIALRNDGTIWTWGDNDDGQLGDGTTTSRTSPVQVPGVAAKIVGCMAGRYVLNDFDGDRMSDFVVRHVASGTWYILPSSTRQPVMFQFGALDDLPIHGDFDGDLHADLAVCNPSQGTWSIYQSSDNSIRTRVLPGGGDGFIPVGGSDVNGDGKTDLTLVDPLTGSWACEVEDAVAIGITGSTPIGGDFDGDGRSDRAAYSGASGQWFTRLSQMEAQSSFNWISGCEGFAGDFNGDRKADPFIYSEAAGLWCGLLSGINYALVWLSFGGITYSPVPGDYDGDGKTDPAVYHEASGYWYYLLSSSEYALSWVQWGAPSYRPVK